MRAVKKVSKKWKKKSLKVQNETQKNEKTQKNEAETLPKQPAKWPRIRKSSSI